MDQNYPFIHLYGAKAGDKDAEGTKVSIAFSKERVRDRDSRVPEIREGDWICASVSLLHSRRGCLQGANWLRQCITHNFSKRLDCIKCGSAKSGKLCYEFDW